MSSSFMVFAERRIDEEWALIGDPAYSEHWGCLCPPTVFELPGRNQLVTILCGQLTVLGGHDHTGLEAIDQPRGLPEDVSAVLRNWAELNMQHDLVHHPSWLLVSEILDFDWHTPNILHRGYVMANMARHFDAEHPERPFPAHVWPGGWYEVGFGLKSVQKRVPASESCKERFVFSQPREGTVEVYWTESHYQTLGRPDWFFTELRELGPPDDVRLVFWIEA